MSAPNDQDLLGCHACANAFSPREELVPSRRSGSGPDGAVLVPRWVALAGIVLVALSLRPSIISVGPVLPAILSDFQLSHTMGSLLTAIPDLLMGLLALAAPVLAGRFGRDATIIAALFILGLATLARGFAWNEVTLLITTAGVGTGIAIAGALIAGFVKERFAGHAAAVMGIYAAALSVGSTISAAATGALSSLTYGWRFALGAWSVLSLISVLAWLIVARYRGGNSATSSKAHRLPISNPKAWGIAIFFAMNNFLFYSILAWMPSIYQEAGRTASEASFILASFTLVFMVANPVFGFLSRSRDRRVWLCLAGLSAFVGLLGVTTDPTWHPLVFVPLCAFGLGGTFTLGMTLPLDNAANASEANSWNAFVLLVGYVVAAAGPFLSGFLRDYTGSFSAALAMMTVCAAVMTAVGSLLRPSKLQR